MSLQNGLSKADFLLARKKVTPVALIPIQSSDFSHKNGCAALWRDGDIIISVIKGLPREVHLSEIAETNNGRRRLVGRVMKALRWVVTGWPPQAGPLLNPFYQTSKPPPT